MTLSELRSECLNCNKCELSKNRTNVVFGVGNENAEVLFVGEGPGKYEDETGEPFVGRSGQLLNHYLEAVGLSREGVYIANIVKCRPPENRDPKPEEQDICIGWLKEQYKLIKPKIIVCLGRIAAQRMIDPNFKVTKQHGELIQKGNVLMMGTFHPSALLRNPNNKPEALSDFKNLAKKLTDLR